MYAPNYKLKLTPAVFNHYAVSATFSCVFNKKSQDIIFDYAYSRVKCRYNYTRPNYL